MDHFWPGQQVHSLGPPLLRVGQSFQALLRLVGPRREGNASAESETVLKPPPCLIKVAGHGCEVAEVAERDGTRLVTLRRSVLARDALGRPFGLERPRSCAGQ